MGQSAIIERDYDELIDALDTIEVQLAPNRVSFFQ